MMYQHPYLGYISEIPDQELSYGYVGEAPGDYFAEYPEEIGQGQVVYDALGNPVGIIPGLIRAATNILPSIARGVTSLFRRGGPQAPPAQPITPPLPPAMSRLLSQIRPPGWIRPPVPFTGLRPRRVYMRCLMWPGQRGLIPASATTVGPAGFIPGVTPPPVPPPVARRGRRGRSGGRRR